MRDCSKCTAICCRQHDGHQYAVILDKDEDIKHDKAVTIDGVLCIPYDENGDCVYLEDNKCSIYDHRPKNCMDFDCEEFFNQTCRHGGVTYKLADVTEMGLAIKKQFNE